MHRVSRNSTDDMMSQNQTNSETPLKLTEENFDKVVSGAKPAFVDYWAVWCGPCRIMDPVVEKLAKKYSDKVTFGKVNVDEEINISSRYQIFSIPTFMIFRDGQPLDAMIGAVGEASLEKLIVGAIG